MTKRAVIVGVGEAPCGRYPDRPALDVAVSICEEAIRDSGLDRRDIDAILVGPCFADPWFNTDLGFSRMVDELAMRETVKMNAQINAGGSTGMALLRNAVALVESGQAKAVLCMHVEKFTNFSDQAGFDFFARAGIERDFEAPFGMVYNAMPAMVAHRYMHETGTTVADIAEATVSARAWAALHPNAMFRKPLTVDEVLASKVIASPMNALMLNMLGDGGNAFVVTTAERAKGAQEQPIYIWGEGGIVSSYSFAQHRDLTQMNWSVAAGQAFEQARVTPKDIKIAEIYVAYPVFHMFMLEEMGFCKRGEAAALFRSGATRPGGSLPVATFGDAMSYGHIGAGIGLAALTESVRQLRGECGDRQVPGADIVLKTTASGAYADAQVTIFGKEPR